MAIRFQAYRLGPRGAQRRPSNRSEEIEPLDLLPS